MPFVWDLGHVSPQRTKPERAGEDSPPEEGGPRPCACSSPATGPGVKLEAPASCCVLPVWKMCQEAVAPLGEAGLEGAVSGSPQEHGVAWKRWVSSVHQGAWGEGSRTAVGVHAPHPFTPSRAPRVQPLRSVARRVRRGASVSSAGYEKEKTAEERAVS